MNDEMLEKEEFIKKIYEANNWNCTNIENGGIINCTKKNIGRIRQ